MAASPAQLPPRLGIAYSVGRSVSARRSNAGFSLIEIAVALGIVSFALISILSLLPLGMTTFLAAVDMSVGTQICQRVVNDLQQTDFSTLVNSPQLVRYFDEQGQEVTTAAESVYQVNVRVEPSLTLPGVTTANGNMANIVIQIARNSSHIALTKDSSNLWVSTNGVRFTTYSTVISGCN